MIELRGEQEGGKEKLTLIKKRLETRFESISFRFSADESSGRHIDWLRLRGKKGVFDLLPVFESSLRREAQIPIFSFEILLEYDGSISNVVVE